MWSDLFALYHVDADKWLADNNSADRLAQLIARLQHEPMSLHRADTLGNAKFIGWGSTQSLLAHITDGVFFTAQAAAQNKARFTPIIEPPEPHIHTQVDSTKAKRVADMDWGTSLTLLGG